MTDTLDSPLDPPTPTEPVDLLDLDEPVEALLEQWLEQSLVEIGDEPRDQEQADRLLWALRRLRQRRADVIEAAQARVLLISAWANTETEKLDRRAAHIEQVLEGWAHAEHHVSGRKTWALAAGELRIRPLLRRAVVVGNPRAEATVDAVRALVPEAVKTTEEVQAGKVKAVAEPEGRDVTNWAISQGVDVPAGYRAERAIIKNDPGDPEPSFSVMPGVVLLVPLPGREGQKFTAATD